jgi:hypothetical protein
VAEPERHFALVKAHIRDLKQIPEFQFSTIQIFVERNLGFEAEHFERALQFEEHVVFYRDMQANRTGILTTDNVKLAAMTMTNVMLREQRVNLVSESVLVSRNPQETRRKIREQLEIYSLQFKTADTVFQKNKFALSGKVGGFKDDIVICLQLGIYWTESGRILDEIKG